MNIITIISLVIATLFPAFFLWFMKSQDLYGTGSFRNVMLAFAGGVAAFAIAYAESGIVQGPPLWVSNDTWVRFMAPMSEEILKCLVLIYLVRRPTFTY